jgi:hypothetical protein
MNQNTTDEKSIIAPEMTILEIVSKYRHAETVFKQYDEKARVCLCCKALFDPLKDIADKYYLNLEEIMTDLKKIIKDRS